MKPTSQGRILLIDDDPDVQDIYREFLTSAGFLVEIARNGEEGLAKILEGGYDLILLDIMMPQIDGITLLKKVKEASTQRLIYNGPIIVLSVLDQPQIVNTALELGAKGYLVKSGLTPDQALDKIHQFLTGSARQG